MEEINPLVTINILSYNRKDDLRNTLQKVYAQNYKNIEVIVVDNNSSDGSAELVESKFPDVKLIRLKKNTGIAGWNEGFKVAKGEYVLVLDDDSYPEENTLRKALAVILNDPKCGVVACSVFNFRKKEYETKSFLTAKVKAFIGCGALISKSLFDIVGYFSKIFFIYLHEEDFSIRVIENGYNINYVSEAVIIHNNSPEHRLINRREIDYRRYYFGLRNILIFLFLYFNLFKVVMRMIKISFGRLLFGIRYHCFLTALRAIVSFLIMIPTLYKQRNVVSIQTQKYYEFGKILGGIFYSENEKAIINKQLLQKLKIFDD